MDVGVYVTSLRALKNLLLIGDVVRGIQFVAFQVSTFLALNELFIDASTIGGPV